MTDDISETMKRELSSASLLRAKAADLRVRADRLEKLANALPEWMGNEAESTLRDLIISDHML
jgi:hypothetical protein